MVKERIPSRLALLIGNSTVVIFFREIKNLKMFVVMPGSSQKIKTDL